MNPELAAFSLFSAVKTENVWRETASFCRPIVTLALYTRVREADSKRETKHRSFDLSDTGLRIRGGFQRNTGHTDLRKSVFVLPIVEGCGIWKRSEQG